MAGTDAELNRSMTVLEMAHRVHQELNDKATSAAGLTLNQALVLSEIVTANGFGAGGDVGSRGTHVDVGGERSGAEEDGCSPEHQG